MHDQVREGSDRISLLSSGSIKVACIRDFLPISQRNALFDAVCKKIHARDPDVMESEGAKFIGISDDSKMEKQVMEAKEALTEQIFAALPSLFNTLDIPSFSVKDLPVTIVNGGDGHFGAPHIDTTYRDCHISILYYFHRVPKVFRGGSVDFYPHDESSPKGYGDGAVLSVEPEDNLLVAFPSKTFHGVTEVQSDSEDFADGRFVVIGFLGP